MRCPNCGVVNKEEALFCKNCGQKLVRLREYDSGRNIEKQKFRNINNNNTDFDYEDETFEESSHGFLKLAIILLIVLVPVTGFMVFFAFRTINIGKTGKTPKKEVSVESELTSSKKESKTAETTTESSNITMPEKEETSVGNESSADKKLPEKPEPVEEEPAEEEPEEEPVEEEPANNYNYNDDFIFPDSDSRYLSESELYGLTSQQLRIARNEIYARHGRRFNDQGLMDYFNSCDWYEGTIDPEDFSESVFNQYERSNLDTIIRYEKN